MEYAIIYADKKGKWNFSRNLIPRGGDIFEEKIWWEGEIGRAQLMNHMAHVTGYRTEIVSRLQLGDEPWTVLTGNEEYAVIYQTKKGNWKFVNCVISDYDLTWHEDLATAQAEIIDQMTSLRLRGKPPRAYDILARQKTACV